MRLPTLTALLLLQACGSDGSSSDADADSDSDSDSDSDVDSDSDTGPCEGTNVEHTGGLVLGPDGPLEGAAIGFCLRTPTGTNLCLQPIETIADGSYSIDIPEQFQCLEHAVDRVSADGMAVTYCLLDLTGVDGELAAPDFTLFPLEGPEPVWGPGKDDEIVYAADDGAEVTLRPSDVVPAAEAELRMMFIDSTVDRPCFLPDGQELSTLYAMGPEAVVMRDGGLPARLVDHAGLAEGTVVDLYMLGSLLTGVGEDAVVEGSWEAFAESTVDAEGFIETPDGEGLRQLGWVGAVAR